MTITLITPTADQPRGMALAEYYMQRQTLAFDQWIVADDGNTPATLTMGQQHIVRPREHEGGRSLAGNILAALPHAIGDMIVIIEHDDYYAPNHLEVCAEYLQAGAWACGSGTLRYYNLPNRCWRVMKNNGSALCNTALTREALPHLEAAAQTAFEQNIIGLDGNFWRRMAAVGAPCVVHGTNTVVGIKGLPGRAGLGIGHRPKPHQWVKDRNWQRLRIWLGDADAQNYINIMAGAA